MTAKEPGIRGNLRPDLVGVVLELDDTSTDLLRTGQTATLQVAGVYDHADPDCVLAVGLWCGPDGPRDRAKIRVRVTALPTYRLPAGNH